MPVRKLIVACVLAAIFGVGLGSAQRGQQTITTQRGDGTRISVTADDFTLNPVRQATFTGNVAIRANGVTILANRAVLTSDDNGHGVEYQVTGDVRVRVAPPTP